MSFDFSFVRSFIHFATSTARNGKRLPKHCCKGVLLLQLLRAFFFCFVHYSRIYSVCVCALIVPLTRRQSHPNFAISKVHKNDRNSEECGDWQKWNWAKWVCEWLNHISNNHCNGSYTWTTNMIDVCLLMLNNQINSLNIRVNNYKTANNISRGILHHQHFVCVHQSCFTSARLPQTLLLPFHDICFSMFFPVASLSFVCIA